MSDPHSELARRAFDTVAGLQAVSSLADLEDVAQPAFRGLGFPYFATARFFRRDKTPDTAVLFGSFHAGWAKRYSSRNYAGGSQIARRMLESSAPYAWNDVLKTVDPDPVQTRIWLEARDFGVKDGYFTPLRASDGSYIAVALGGDSPDLADPMVRTAAQVVSSFYASAGLTLLRHGPGRRPVLTERQRECLCWVRQGKSSPAIAEILGVSADTVDEHIAQACRRLGVRTRVQAVVEACLAGLIDG